MTSDLPNSSVLPIDILSQIFGSTTNSYKFLWFLSILDLIKNGQRKIEIDTILQRMVYHSYYPLAIYKLDFGQQDKMIDIVQQLISYKSTISKPGELESAITTLFHQNRNFKDKIRQRKRYVPYRLLAPFFSEELEGLKSHEKQPAIKKLSQAHYTDPEYYPLYRISNNTTYIEVQPLWFSYFHKHLKLLYNFVYWEFVTYLQDRNSQTPNIVSKIFWPQNRDLFDARDFWKIYLAKTGSFLCIFSGKEVTLDNVSLDHFLPWSFVAHDQLWNISPTLKEVNSSKGNLLPDLSRYLESFCYLQYDAFQLVTNYQKGKLVEDYTILFKKPISQIRALDKFEFVDVLGDTILPLHQIAQNMGFQKGWFW